MMPIEQKVIIGYLKKLLETAQAGVRSSAEKEVLMRIPSQVGSIPHFLLNPDENRNNLVLLIGDMEYFVKRDLKKDLPERPVELKNLRIGIA